MSLKITELAQESVTLSYS